MFLFLRIDNSIRADPPPWGCALSLYNFLGLQQDLGNVLHFFSFQVLFSKFIKKNFFLPLKLIIAKNWYFYFQKWKSMKRKYTVSKILYTRTYVSFGKSYALGVLEIIRLVLYSFLSLDILWQSTFNLWKCSHMANSRGIGFESKWVTFLRLISKSALKARKNLAAFRLRRT